MKIGTRLIVGFLAITALIWVTFFFAANNYTKMHEEHRILEKHILPSVIATLEIKAKTQETRAWTSVYALRGNVVIMDKPVKEWILENIISSEKLTKEHTEHETLLGLEEQRAAEELENVAKQFNSAIVEVIDTKDQGAELYELMEKMEESFAIAFPPLVRAIDEHQTHHGEELAESAETILEVHTSGSRILLLTAGFVTLLAAAIALFITRSIVNPLDALHKGVEEVRQGNFDYKVGTGSKDEIGHLSRHFDQMTEDLKETTTSIDNLNKEITQRKQAEEELRQAVKEWRTTFDSITDLVTIHDKDFRLVKVNKVFAETLKMKPEELIGKHCYEVVHGTNEPAPNCPHKQTLADGKSHRAEFFEPHLGIHLELSTFPIFNDKGEVVGTVHITKDITERKQAEEKLG